MPSPRDDSLYVPSRTAEHARTFVSWPCRPELWDTHLAEAEVEYAAVVEAIARFEPVTVIFRPGTQPALPASTVHEVRGAEVPIDDSWVRDNGPIFVVDGHGGVAAVSLGFNAWGGKFAPFADDAELPARIAAATRAVRDAGVPVYFMVGNRDFLLGETYAKRAGFTLLEDGTVRPIHGTPTLLMHGDLLCTDDVAYQAVRKQVRTPQWKAQILAMPLAARRAFAAKSRAESRAHTGSTQESIMDVNADAVAAAMRQAGVTRLIHGHTHRPAIHDFTLDSHPAQRIVLGDWYEQGSVLRVDDAGVALRSMAAG